MTEFEIRREYAALREAALVPLSKRIEAHLHSVLEGVNRIDRITARAKDVERFVAKATRQEGGNPKYSDPLHQIQDQIGARIVVLYLSDVSRVAGIVEQHLRSIEARDLIPESESEFGYFGRHFVCLMPTDVFDAEIVAGVGPRFFELQVKTLFQHAWAEANHDLAYKPLGELSSLQKRKVAFSAAQAWGADTMFDELHRDLSGHGHNS
ncbi:MAG TPA: RelA/SpoT domain-containing protein [Polyangia bacterium]|nr:RelA/SpoT domain-containing protein [Polyangia bacterium]